MLAPFAFAELTYSNAKEIGLVKLILYSKLFPFPAEISLMKSPFVLPVKGVITAELFKDVVTIFVEKELEYLSQKTPATL